MHTKKKKEKMKRITLSVPEGNHTEVKIAASLLGITIKEFIERSIETYIKKENERTH